MTSHHRYCAWDGSANGRITAAASTAMPAYWSPSPRRFILALPPSRLERLEADEEREDREVHVVDDVLRVEDALRERVEVLDHRQLAQHRLPDPARRVAAPADDPEHEEHDERDGAGHDLFLEERRDADADGDERRAHEQEADVAREQRAPLDAREVRHGAGVEEREHEHRRVEDERGEELRQQHGAVPHRVRQEELDGPRAPLLGEEPHGDERHQQEQDHAHVREERAQHAVGRIEVAPHLRVHRGLHRRHRVVGEDRVEEVAGDEEEAERDAVGDGRREVEPQLLLHDRPDVHGAASSGVTASSTAGASCSPPSSPATMRMKTSSSVIPTRRSSRSGQRRAIASWKISPRTSRSRAASTEKAALPSPVRTSRTSRTPGIVRSASRALSAGAASSTCTRLLGKNSSTSESIGPCAITLPLLMMITPLHTIETSGRMCVERITVCSPASDLISARISVIWRGSRPMVGSSRMRTCGSLTIACASPTRWR